MTTITFTLKRKATASDVNYLIRWLGESLGLFSLRDKDSSCYRIFIELIKSSRVDRQLSSDELAFRSSLSRGTVIHHIHKLMDTGLVVKSQNKYMLRQQRLTHIIDELRKDTNRLFDNMYDVAAKIDQDLFL